MKKFRNLPAIVTLLAGFIACVIMIKDRYELVGFLWRLVLVMVVFYAFGLLISVILNVAFKEAEKKKKARHKKMMQKMKKIHRNSHQKYKKTRHRKINYNNFYHLVYNF